MSTDNLNIIYQLFDDWDGWDGDLDVLILYEVRLKPELFGGQEYAPIVRVNWYNSTLEPCNDEGKPTARFDMSLSVTNIPGDSDE